MSAWQLSWQSTGTGSTDGAGFLKHLEQHYNTLRLQKNTRQSFKCNSKASWGRCLRQPLSTPSGCFRLVWEHREIPPTASRIQDPTTTQRQFVVVSSAQRFPKLASKVCTREQHPEWSGTLFKNHGKTSWTLPSLAAPTWVPVTEMSVWSQLCQHPGLELLKSFQPQLAHSTALSSKCTHMFMYFSCKVWRWSSIVRGICRNLITSFRQPFGARPLSVHSVYSGINRTSLHEGFWKHRHSEIKRCIIFIWRHFLIILQNNKYFFWNRLKNFVNRRQILQKICSKNPN